MQSSREVQQYLGWRIRKTDSIMRDRRAGSRMPYDQPSLAPLHQMREAIRSSALSSGKRIAEWQAFANSTRGARHDEP